MLKCWIQHWVMSYIYLFFFSEWIYFFLSVKVDWNFKSDWKIFGDLNFFVIYYFCLWSNFFPTGFCSPPKKKRNGYKIASQFLFVWRIPSNFFIVFLCFFKIFSYLYYLSTMNISLICHPKYDLSFWWKSNPIFICLEDIIIFIICYWHRVCMYAAGLRYRVFCVTEVCKLL